MNQTEKFLDMELIHCTNGDGIVLMVKGNHCGNYSKIDEAKIDALRYFIVFRPEIFSNSVVNKIRHNGSGTQHEWFLFIRTLKAEGFEIPKDIEAVDSFNMMIGFKGKTI